MYGLAIASLFKALSDLLIASGAIGLASEAAKFKSANLAATSLNEAMLIVLITAVILTLILLTIKYYDIIALDDFKQQTLGVNVRRVKFVYLVIVCLIVTVSVVFIGIVTFIGMIVPHVAYRLNYQSTRGELIATFMLGAILLTSADYLAANLFYPVSLFAGIFTAIIGVPVFIYIMYSKEKNGNSC